MITSRTARNLTNALANRVAQLPESEQDITIAALEDSSRRCGWLDRDRHEYVVLLDGQEFVRLSMDELLA